EQVGGRRGAGTRSDRQGQGRGRPGQEGSGGDARLDGMVNVELQADLFREVREAEQVFVGLRGLAQLCAKGDLAADQIEDTVGTGAESRLLFEVRFDGNTLPALPALSLVVQQSDDEAAIRWSMFVAVRLGHRGAHCARGG